MLCKSQNSGVLSTLLVTDLKSSTIWAAGMKINSTSAVSHALGFGRERTLSSSCLLLSSGAGGRIKRLHNASQKSSRKPPLAAVLEKKPVLAAAAVIWFGGGHS